MASTIKSVLSGLGYGAGFGTAYSTMVDNLRTAVTWAKWKAIGYTLGYPVMADLMQRFLDAEKDEVTGLSTKGMIDVIWGFIDKTLDFAMVLNENIANQLFIQMIQQSVAYALGSSHAGSIGTVANVYSGSAPLSTFQASSIGSTVDYTDRNLKAFLSAEVGQNIPSLAFSLVQGANQRLEELYRAILRDVDNLLNEWNDLAHDYYRHYHSMARTRLENALEMKEQLVTRAYALLEQVGNEHLARISEQLDTLEGAYEWYKAGLLSDSELEDIALRVKLEVEASIQNYNEYKEEILSSVEDALVTWDEKIDNALNDLKQIEFKYAMLIRNILSTLFTDVERFANAIVDMVDKAIEDVCAYRNVNKSVSVEVVTELHPALPFLPVEVDYLYWRRWESIPDYTVEFETQNPRTLNWRDADEDSPPYEKVSEVVELRWGSWISISDYTVISHYQSPHGVKWCEVS